MEHNKEPVTQDSDPISDERHGLLFDIRRSVRYHTYRRRFFDTLNTSVTALSLIMGSLTVATALSALYKDYGIYTGAIITALSALNLVIRSSEKARLHLELAKRFIDLEKEIVGVTEPTKLNLQEWTTQRLTIEADEPPIKRVLDSICHNEMLQSMGYQENEFYEIKGYQRLFAQVWDINAHKIKKTKPQLESRQDPKQLQPSS